MKKLFLSLILVIFYFNISIADMKSDASNYINKAQACYFSLPSYAQDSAIDSWIDAKKYFIDAVKEENMGDPRNLAAAFYRNSILYAKVVLQIGSAYGSQLCR